MASFRVTATVDFLIFADDQEAANKMLAELAAEITEYASTDGDSCAEVCGPAEFSGLEYMGEGEGGEAYDAIQEADAEEEAEEDEPEVVEAKRSICDDCSLTSCSSHPSKKNGPVVSVIVDDGEDEIEVSGTGPLRVSVSVG